MVAGRQFLQRRVVILLWTILLSSPAPCLAFPNTVHGADARRANQHCRYLQMVAGSTACLDAANICSTSIGTYKILPNKFRHGDRHNFGFQQHAIRQGPRSISSPHPSTSTTTTTLFMAPSPENDDSDVMIYGDDYQSSLPETIFSWLMILLPALSLVFPALLELARSQTPNSTEQFTILAALLASNRVYLYAAMSTTIVALVALRSASQDSVALGQRVVDVTEELLYNPPLKGSGSIATADTATTTMEANVAITKKEDNKKDSKYQSSAMIQNLSNELGDSLDDVSSETQAILLPVLVAALFASSFFFVQLLNSGGGNGLLDGGGDDNTLVLLFQTYGPLLTSLWNGLILTLFARCEVRRLFLSNRLVSNNNSNNNNSIANAAPWILGAVITALAFGGVWPAQNFVNMALAILVARAIQINNLPAILGALSLLTLYDATSVLFLPANAADLGVAVSNAMVDSSSTMSTSTTSSAMEASHMLVAAGSTSDAGTVEAAAKSSAMGAVAMNKLTGNFQPGLLITRLEGRLGGALGLGDAVFPSLLATMARRFDLESRNSSGGGGVVSLFASSMVGYVAGCLACELLPILSSSGVPALLLIVPFMVASTVGAAALQGRLDDFWMFDPVVMDSQDGGF